MKKKIGLCACYDTFNYGSMLQAWATGMVLERFDFSYEFIRYRRKPTVGLVLRSIDRFPEIVLKKIKRNKQNRQLTHYPKVKEGLDERHHCFERFTHETFVNVSPVYDTFYEIRKAASHYDAVMVGSDQLWNPVGFSTRFYNLMFVPDEVPKIAYATSFGVNEIPGNKRKSAKIFLNRIQYISVRELRASEIILELTGRNVPTTVDPTLLFTAAEWEAIIPQKKVLKKEDKYIFCYLLGANPLHRKWANDLKQQTGYKLVTIPHLDEFVEEDVLFGDQQLFNVGPAEFVNLIRNAECICTDSFHGTVFSILNHKPFVTFDRFSDKNKDSRNSRIDSLLKQTLLETRRCKKNDQNIVSIMNEEIDYEKIDKALARMREQSIDYLKEALSHI